MSEPTVPADVGQASDYRHIILMAASASLCTLARRDDPGVSFTGINSPGATCPICKRIWAQLRLKPRD